MLRLQGLEEISGTCVRPEGVEGRIPGYDGLGARGCPRSPGPYPLELC